MAPWAVTATPTPRLHGNRASDTATLASCFSGMGQGLPLRLEQHSEPDSRLVYGAR